MLLVLTCWIRESSTVKAGQGLFFRTPSNNAIDFYERSHVTNSEVAMQSKSFTSFFFLMNGKDDAKGYKQALVKPYGYRCHRGS